MNTDKIARYLWIGRKDIDWYKDCQSVFVELFGEHRLSLVCQLFAATSINTSLKANITLFRRALHEIDNNLPRSKYLPNIEQQIDQIRSGKPLTGRKIRSFASAMSGDKNAVVVDVWLLRAFDMDRKYFRKEPANTLTKTKKLDIEARENFMKVFNNLGFHIDDLIPAKEPVIKKRGMFRSGGASDNQYTKIEAYIRDEAKAMGLNPCQMSAMIWSGVRIDQGGDRETHYKTLLRLKHNTLFNM